MGCPRTRSGPGAPFPTPQDIEADATAAGADPDAVASLRSVFGGFATAETSRTQIWNRRPARRWNERPTTRTTSWRIPTTWLREQRRKRVRRGGQHVTLRRVPLALGLVATAIGLGLAALGAPLLPSGAVSDLPILAVAVFAGGVALLALLVRSLDSDRGVALPDTDSRTSRSPATMSTRRLVLGPDKRQSGNASKGSQSPSSSVTASRPRRRRRRYARAHGQTGTGPEAVRRHTERSGRGCPGGSPAFIRSSGVSPTRRPNSGSATRSDERGPPHRPLVRAGRGRSGRRRRRAGGPVPALVLLGGLGVTLSAYDRVAVPPAADISIQRSITPTEPALGERVTVALTVHNDGSRTIPDLRLADGVPTPACSRGVGVAWGGTTPRRVDDSHLRNYRGTDRCVFDPATVVVRDVVGVVARRTRVTAEPDTVTWEQPASSALLPLVPAVARRPGTVPVDEGGEGLSFYAVREHRSNDPLSRVDWNQYARTGDLRTVEFRREQSATVVVVVDARAAAALAPRPDAETAIERSTMAAVALVEGLPEDGHEVGVAAYSPHDAWLAPGTSAAHQQQARDLLRTDRAFAATSVTRTPDTTKLIAQLPTAANIVFLGPLCDDDSEALVRRLAATGHPVTVLSPDPTATDTAGHRLARLERRERLRRLRAADIAVHDWPAAEPLDESLNGSGGVASEHPDWGRLWECGAGGERRDAVRRRHQRRLDCRRPRRRRAARRRATDSVRAAGRPRQRVVVSGAAGRRASGGTPTTVLVAGGATVLAWTFVPCGYRPLCGPRTAPGTPVELTHVAGATGLVGGTSWAAMRSTGAEVAAGAARVVLGASPTAALSRGGRGRRSRPAVATARVLRDVAATTASVRR